MTQPQPVIAPHTTAAVFLVMTVVPGAEQRVRDELGGLNGLVRSVAFRSPDSVLTCVAGIGSRVWDQLFDGPRPAELHPFRELTGDRHHAVATPGDLLFHVRARRMDLCFELAGHLAGRLGDAVNVVDEVHGFTYFDDRDLLGFVDGSENPTGEAARASVFVGDEDAPFAGGSYVVVQKYLHDMAAWNALSTEEQEKVIGRSKSDNIEMSDETKPADSHVALNTITGDDGEERRIVRQNMPFGTVGRGEFGTYFIGYARTPAVTEQMLENMFIGSPPGNTDRILDFSTAVTGNLFFVPTADFLDDLPDPPAVRDAARERPAPVATPEPVAAPSDGSLGIGGLKGAPAL
ncbi:Dyp-type peroxidase [Streptomyces sp. NPDC046821]|uniref:Dyp-type peroxidase n=1 Tax=Streptomyces sp. NPDC046821 TaxID=3154702 RepID=UPI003408F5DC